MKEFIDFLAYLGGVLFSLMLISGILIVVIVTLQEMWRERDEDEQALYDWKDME